MYLASDWLPRTDSVLVRYYIRPTAVRLAAAAPSADSINFFSSRPVLNRNRRYGTWAAAAAASEACARSCPGVLSPGPGLHNVTGA
jgi:hypothetical protein